MEECRDPADLASALTWFDGFDLLCVGDRGPEVVGELITDAMLRATGLEPCQREPSESPGQSPPTPRRSHRRHAKGWWASVPHRIDAMGADGPSRGRPEGVGPAPPNSGSGEETEKLNGLLPEAT